MKYPLMVLGFVSSFFSCRLQILTSDGHPHTGICVKLGFQPLKNSKGVFGTALVGTQFNIYDDVLRDSIYKDLDSLELLNILCTMSNNVQFLLSATPF